jgi:hypothetical protein
MKKYLRQKGALAASFLLWGTVNFFNNLIQMTGDQELMGTSQIYLDNETRLRSRFAQAGLSNDVISRHLRVLQKQRQRAENRERGQSLDHKLVFEATNVSRSVRLAYGDIMRPFEMDAAEHADR